MPDTIKRKPEDQTQLFEQVCKVERDVIERRRHFIKIPWGGGCDRRSGRVRLRPPTD
jgi:hypothetical protein